MDATQLYNEPLTDDRLFGWYAVLFPTGRSGMYKIKTTAWREDAIQVTSGPMGKRNNPL
ncbi:hypothetical protein [Flavobacterium frigoris]|uniref:hypothetical protein n=1 Tax=Flavobacterium frigoris TaxID=229204 RepID=UPI001FE1939A|nr:hypothetical protein [Flavobacterium frigoris]